MSEMPVGYWTIDVPITPAIAEHDVPILEAAINSLPEGVAVYRMELVIEGRIWEWQRVHTL